MATWDDLLGYLHANYKFREEQPGLITLVFDVGEGRSQLVLLSRQVLNGGSEEWVGISSPFAEVGQVSLQRALEAAGDLVVGGAGIVGTHVVLKHAVPLADMSVDEFERPLMLLMHSADDLERQIFGGDKY